MADDKNVGTARARLKSFVERIEHLEEEKAELADDIKEVYAEAKSEGFDAKIIRKVVTRRKKPMETREEDELLELYEGSIEGLPRIPRRDVRQLDIEDVVRRLDEGPRVQLSDEDGAVLFEAGGKAPDQPAVASASAAPDVGQNGSTKAKTKLGKGDAQGALAAAQQHLGTAPKPPAGVLGTAGDVA